MQSQKTRAKHGMGNNIIWHKQQYTTHNTAINIALPIHLIISCHRSLTYERVWGLWREKYDKRDILNYSVIKQGL